jgi:hypothetical protein
MADSFFETSSQSWFSRIGGAFKGLLFGLVLLPVSVFLLFWNESRAVTTANSLKEGAAAVVSVAADTIVPGNDHKLIHLSGEVTTTESIRDPLFGLSVTALRLGRRVEMYQWKEDKTTETKKKLGGGEETTTRYEYSRAWSDRSVDSSSFRHPEDHTNPSTFPVQKFTVLTSKATLGAFKIPAPIIEKMSNDQPLPPPSDCLAQLPADLKPKARLNAEQIYLGQDPAAPAVGDMRVTFQVLKPAVYSILAQQSGDTLTPYPTKAGREIERVESGPMTAELMFQHAQSENTMLTWGLRFAGFLLMSIGFGAVLKPLSVFGDIVPFIGGIIGFGTSLVSGILGFAGSLIVIAIAWLAARPVLGVTLLVVAVAAIIYAIHRAHQNRTARPATA